MQTVCLALQIRDSCLDLVKARFVPHQLQDSRCAHCRSGAEVATRAFEPVCGAFQPGRIPGGRAPANLGQGARDLGAKNFCQRKQQAAITFDARKDFFHVKGRFGQRSQ